MSPEAPNKKMEELLRRHAQKRRREAGDFSLHPATRRLLQGEIQRQFGRSTGVREGARPKSLFTFLLAWRSAGIAACALALLTAGVWFFSRHAPNEPTSGRDYAKLEAESLRAPKTTADRERDLNRSDVLEAKDAVGAKTTVDEPVRAKAMSVAATKAAPADKAQLDATEKQLALRDAPPPSLAPAPVPAATQPASKADFDQAALSAKEQQVASANTVNNFAFKGGTPGGIAQRGYRNNAQPQVQNAPTAPSPPANTANSQQQSFGGGYESAQQIQQPAASASQMRVAQNSDYFNNAANVAGQAGASATVDQTRAAGQVQARGVIALAEEQASAAPGSELLTRFIVEQRGTNMRVIDADSSIYSGAISNEVASSESLRSETLLKREATPPRAQQLYFRVTGTNRSSGQLVELVGQMPSGGTQQTFAVLPQGEDRRAVQTRAAAQTIPSAPRLPLLTSPQGGRFLERPGETNAVLEGSVKVGAGAPQQLRAIRIAP